MKKKNNKRDIYLGIIKRLNKYLFFVENKKVKFGFLLKSGAIGRLSCGFGDKIYRHLYKVYITFSQK